MTDFLSYQLGPTVFNMSLTASVIIAVVLVARALLRRAPKAVSYALWAVVLLRLLCPVSVPAGFSLLGLLDTPVRETALKTSAVEYVRPAPGKEPQSKPPAPAVSAVGGEAPPREEERPAAGSPAAPAWIAARIWLAGTLAMLLYGVLSLLRLRRRLTDAVPIHGNIYMADRIGSPFVMGLLRPRIYLPSSLSEREQAYIILHEQYHIRRLDHIVKLLAFAALCVHWFNPLVWLAFVLSGRDMEMSCDEAVVRKLGVDIRADYSASLLGLATGRHIIAGAPLAFGEGDTRGRIKNLLNWKRPKPWLIALGALVCAAVIAVCAVNPLGKAQPPSSGLTGQYASMEEFARQTMAQAKTATYYSVRKAQAQEPREATAKVLDTKLARLDKRGEVGGLAPEGTLEAWVFRYEVRIDAETADVALVGGMSEQDGWFDLEGQGGHNLVALRYEDGSYDILCDEIVNDDMDFYGYHHNYEEAIYDWYVAEKHLDLPLYVIALLPDDERGNHPAHRYDGNGWYLYIPVQAWNHQVNNSFTSWQFDSWQSAYGTGSTLTVNHLEETAEEAVSALLGSGWQRIGNGGHRVRHPDGNMEDCYYDAPEGGCYCVRTEWRAEKITEYPSIAIEPATLAAMAERFTVDASFAVPPTAEKANAELVQRVVNGIFVGGLSYDVRWRNPGSYVLTASDRHGRTDTYTVSPYSYGALFSTPGWELVNDFDWTAADASGADTGRENEYTFRFANGRRAVTVYSHENKLRLEEDGVTTLLVGTPHTPNASGGFAELYGWFLQAATAAEAEYGKAVACSVSGSETEYAVVAQKLAEQYVQRMLNRPSWWESYLEDARVGSASVFDAYYGGDKPNFCFEMGLYLRLTEEQTQYWQAGSGLDDPLKSGPYAGYYSWGREISAAKGADGNWHITDIGTGGASVSLPYDLDSATIDQLMELYRMTSGHTHNWRILYRLAEKPLGEVKARLNALSPADRQELTDRFRAFIAEFPDYTTWTAADFE